MDNLVMRKDLREVLRILVKHTEGKLVVLILTINGVFLKVFECVVHPTHVPLEIKAESSLRGRFSYAREGSGFFGNQQSTRVIFVH